MRSNAHTSRQEAPGTTQLAMSDIDALEAAKLIAGTTRRVAGKLYPDEPMDAHERIDALLLSLLEKDYPELVEYVRSLRLWYG